MCSQRVRGTTAAYNKLGGDGPLQPLSHPNPRDHDIRLFSVLGHGVIDAFFHEFGQPSNGAIGSQLHLHDIHRELLWRVAEYGFCGGRVGEDFVALIRSVSYGG